MVQHRNIPSGGAYSRQFTDYSGIFFDEFSEDSAWLRDEARIRLPPLDGIRALVLKGEFRPHPDARGMETRFPGLTAAINGAAAGTISGSKPGPWELRIGLSGVSRTNALAWLGRMTGLGFLQRFRKQNKNRQLRLFSLSTAACETIYDFSQRHAPFSREKS